MDKKYIESYIDITVEKNPDFNNINTLIDYDQFYKKKSNFKLNIVRIVSSLCVACILFIAGVLMVNKSHDSNTPTPSVSGIVNESNSEQDVFPPFQYRITTEKTTYSYDEELEITLEIGFDSFSLPASIGDYFHAKIEESEFYEILGQQEYILKDFDYYDYCGKTESKYPIVYKYKIRPVKESFGLSRINFAFKFNSEYYKGQQEWNSHILTYGNWWFDFSNEYFFHIRGMYFINNKDNIELSVDFSNLVKNNLLADYNNGLVDKETYMDRYINSVVNIDGIAISQSFGEVEYYSENVTIYLKFKDQENEVYLTIKKLIEERKLKEASKIIFETAFKYGDITQEVYEKEMTKMEQKEIRVILYIDSELMPFNDYSDYLYDYEYIIN